MKIISLLVSVILIFVCGYFWIVARIFVGTREVEFLIWKSPYLKELFIWIIIGVPIVLLFQSEKFASSDEEEKPEDERAPPNESDTKFKD